MNETTLPIRANNNEETPVKEINLPEEVKAEIQAKIIELNNLCVAHGLPFVAATVISRTDDGENTAVERISSAYIDPENGATEPTIAAAAKMLTNELKPSDIMKSMMAFALRRLASDDDCNCPRCSARRAEEAAREQSHS